jgi:hypothetical protein
MAPGPAVLDTSAALSTEPVGAVEVDLDLQFTVMGERHEVTLPRDVYRLEKVVEALYLGFGEPAVRSLFLALRQRVRTYEAELKQVRPEESPDPKAREAAEKTRRDKHWQRVLDQKYSRPQRQQRLEIVKVLIRRYVATWESILEHEGQFLRWYEHTVFAATQRMLDDKKAVLSKLWETTYRVSPALRRYAYGVTPASRLEEVAAADDVDLADCRIDPVDPKVRQELFAHTRALAGLWFDYRDALDSLSRITHYTKDPRQIEASMAYVEDKHRLFRERAATLQRAHPTAIVAAKKFEKVLRRPVAEKPTPKEAEALLQRCLIESLVEGYEGAQEFGEHLVEALVFGPASDPLVYDPPDEDYHLRPSTAQLIALRLTGEALLERDASLRSIWCQAPILQRIDRELEDPNPSATPLDDRTLLPNFLKYLETLPPDERRLLAASAVPGLQVHRARAEVQRCLEAIRQADKERLQAVKQGVFAGGVALAWSTGGTSFIVAGYLDAVLTLWETWDTVLAYRSSRAKAALVMTSTEEAFWQTPGLCDFVQQVSSAIVTIAGDLVNAKAAGHVVDALSVAFMFIDQESPNGR